MTIQILSYLKSVLVVLWLWTSTDTKSFEVFKSVTFENFQIFLQIIIVITPLHFLSIFENFKSDTFESDKNCVTFEKFLIFMENTIGIIPNTFHGFQKNSKVTLLKTTKVFTCRSSEPKELKTWYIWLVL